MRALSFSQINSNRVLLFQAEPVTEHVQFAVKCFLPDKVLILVPELCQDLEPFCAFPLRLKMVFGQQNWFCSKTHTGLEQRS